MPKHQYSMLENIIFLQTLSYKEQKRLNRGMARVLLVFDKMLATADGMSCTIKYG